MCTQGFTKAGVLWDQGGICSITANCDINAYNSLSDQLEQMYTYSTSTDILQQASATARHNNIEGNLQFGVQGTSNYWRLVCLDNVISVFFAVTGLVLIMAAA